MIIYHNLILLGLPLVNSYITILDLYLNLGKKYKVTNIIQLVTGNTVQDQL